MQDNLDYKKKEQQLNIKRRIYHYEIRGKAGTDRR